MIGDLFPAAERGRALAFLAVLRSIGIITGQTIASSIGPTSGFRLPFAIVAIPTLILAPIFRCTTKEPIKGGKEQAIIAAAGGEVSENFYNEQMNFAKLKLIFKNKTIVLGYLQGIPGSLPFAVLFTFFQDFLVTDIGGISVEQTTAVVFSFGLGSVLGQFMAGFIVDRLWKWRYEYVPLYCGVTSIIGVLPLYGLINGPSRPIGHYATVLFPVGIILAQAGLGLGVVFLNVTLPETRGTASGLGGIFGDIGSAIGPIAVGGFVAATGNRRSAFSISISFLFLAAIFMLCICFTVRKDVERTEAAQKEALIQAGKIRRESPTETIQQPSSISSSSNNSGSDSELVTKKPQQNLNSTRLQHYNTNSSYNQSALSSSNPMFGQ